MNSVVLVRYIYFLACFFLHVALAIVAGVSVHSSAPELIAPSAGVFSLAIFGALVLLGLLGFDLNRTRTGFAHFCFVFKIWFELSVMTSLMILHIVTFIIIFCQNRVDYCDYDAPACDDTACTVLRFTWAFQILIAGTILLYVAYLGFVAASYYPTSPKVLHAAVRDIPWSLRAARRNKGHDMESRIHYPSMTQPTFDHVPPVIERGKGFVLKFRSCLLGSANR